MAATWTALDANSWFGAAWVCDMGPYIGPLSSVGNYHVDYLPINAAELAFFVGDFTGSAADGTLQPGGPGASRFRRGDGTEQSSEASINPPTGADPYHLVVAWYPLDYPASLAGVTPPNLKPEQVVPCIYVRGGRGPYFGPSTTGGHWSDWITLPAADVTVRATNHGLSSQVRQYTNARQIVDRTTAPGSVPNPTHADPDRSLGDLLTAGLGHLRSTADDPYNNETDGTAGFPSTDGAWRFGDSFDRRTSGNSLDFAGVGVRYLRTTLARDSYEFNLGLTAIPGALYFAAPVSAQPDSWYTAQLSGLGVTDWGVNPDTGRAVEVDGVPTRVGWGELQMHWSRYCHAQRQVAGTITSPDIAATFSVRVLSSDAAPVQSVPYGGTGTNVDTFWPDPSAGTELASISIPVGTVNTQGDPVLDSDGSVYPLAGVVPAGDDHVWLYLRPSLLDPVQDPPLGIAELPNAAVDPSGFTNSQTGNQFVGGASLGYNINIAAAPQVTVQVQPPRFRYWIPGRPTLRCCPNQKLRTITIQRGTVPGSWSDWQPGYAVTGDGGFTSPTTGTGNGGVRSASVDIDHRNAAGGGGTTAEELPYAPHDLRDLGAQVLLAARAAAPSDGSVRGVVYVTGTKLGQYGYQSFGPLAAHFEWSAYVAFAQEYTQFRLPDNALPDHPAPLDAGGLPGNRPDGSPGWQWEAPTLTDVHWNNLPVTQYGYSTSSGIFLQDPAAVYDAATYTFTVPVEYFAVPGNTLQSGTWVDLTGAVKIGELNLQFVLKSGSYIGGPNSYQSTPVSGTLDLSGVDFAEMMIVAQAKAVRTGGAELFRDVSEIPQTGSRNSLNAYSYDMVADIYVTHGNGDIGGELFGFSGPGPGYVTYTAQTPRWRYWIPGDPNVEIPTCVAQQGGHWGVPLGDFSGARLTQLRKP